MDNKVIVIPVAVSDCVLGSAKTALCDGARLFLGAPREHLSALKAKFLGQENVHCEEFDRSSPKQAAAFFKKAHARFHRVDCLLLSEEIWPPDGEPDEIMGSGARILLQCLDASLRCVDEELHIITVSQDKYRRAAILIARTYLRAKMSSPYSTIRMTAISSTGTQALPDGPPPLTTILVPRQTSDEQQYGARQRDGKRTHTSISTRPSTANQAIRP
ncbi:hypothetical protein HYPDE_41168 [Hyphomicrobium denitrificans 1NES1]|uniref:Uncharacterized protein n=1 Tax=Hyphomicrobium denitrificans 1NES1 TaxID=670307 RepID=N0BCE2_9HYPH|nr:hypothetical protein [Hyphomicrobium denitrificans]AGK59902.1 hypothetical protein HYPDE_41168 [Hyphomicrobium denitrificans 1NES1]